MTESFGGDGKQRLELLTDLYGFTMSEAYFQSTMFAPATFSLFIRDYPPQRGYFISAGLRVARAGYIVGLAGTSNVLAGKIYQIPLAGTMAHSLTVKNC